jgi:hypothetical protein
VSLMAGPGGVRADLFFRTGPAPKGLAPRGASCENARWAKIG